MRTKIAKWGNSLSLPLPNSLTTELGLAEGAMVDLTVSNGRLIIAPIPAVPTLDELLAGITPENRHDEVDWGPAVGREFS